MPAEVGQIEFEQQVFSMIAQIFAGHRCGNEGERQLAAIGGVKFGDDGHMAVAVCGGTCACGVIFRGVLQREAAALQFIHQRRCDIIIRGEAAHKGGGCQQALGIKR